MRDNGRMNGVTKNADESRCERISTERLIMRGTNGLRQGIIEVRPAPGLYRNRSTLVDNVHRNGLTSRSALTDGSPITKLEHAFSLGTSIDLLQEMTGGLTTLLVRECIVLRREK